MKFGKFEIGWLELLIVVVFAVFLVETCADVTKDVYGSGVESP